MKPEHRDPFIDRLRVVSVLVVVLGHWTSTTVFWTESRIVGESVLGEVTELHLVTWLLQVMPLLFFVGGFANAQSYHLHDSHYLNYLRSRLIRVLTPTACFVVVWLVIGIVAQLLPLPQPNLIERGADIAALPFWFIGLYVVVVALAPAMLRLHGRWRRRIPAALVIGAVAVDIVTWGFGLEYVGLANYAFVWLFAHQLGFFYRDGVFQTVGPRGLAVGAAGGLTVLVFLTTAAGYPVSLIFVPGAERLNSEPPSLAIVAATVWLISLALLIRPALVKGPKRGWLDRLNAVPLSMYLWHISALVPAVAVLYAIGFPQSDPGSQQWWVWRPVWLATLTVVLGLIVMVVRRFEIHPQPGSRAETGGAPLAVLGVVLVAIGLLGFGVTGFNLVATRTGEGLFGFTMSPLLNVVHGGLGALALRAVFGGARRDLWGTAIGMALLGVGIINWSTDIEVFGANQATGILGISLGVLGLLAGAVGRTSDSTGSTAGR